MTEHTTDRPLQDAIARVVNSAFDWRKTQKDLIAADGDRAIAASSAHKRASRKLSEAVDIAAQKGGDA